MIASLLITLAAGFGASKLKLRNDYRVFFSRENPQLAEYERFQKIYTKEDNIMFILTWPEQDVFSTDYLEAVRWLTDEAWKLPFSTRVDSVSNFQHSEAEADDLVVGDLVPEPITNDQQALDKYKRIAHSEPLLENRAVGHRADVNAVVVTLLLPEKDSMEAVEAAAAARELRERFTEKFPQVDVRLTGIVMLNNAFAEASMKDMTVLTPMMYFGMFIVMAWMLRSVAGTAGTIFVIILSSATAMGMMGWLGIPLTPPSAVAPTIIMTLAVADSIHLLVTFMHYLREGHNRRESMIEALRVNFQPIFLTSLTTVIGFLSLNFSDAPPFRHLGNVVAIGVVAAWIFSIFFLPAFMVVAPFRKRSAADDRSGWVERFPDFILRHRTAGLWGSVAVVALLAAFIPRIELNDQWVKYFNRSIEFRNDTDYAMENLTGIYSIEFSVNAGDSGAISEPDYLENLEAFATWLRERTDVMQVNSIADIMKRLNKNMHGDDESWYRIPDSRELAAQYLLLFEMSLPYGLDLNNQIDVDKSASRVTVTTGNVTTREVRALLQEAGDWQQQNLPPHMVSEATSPTVMFSYISERNIKSMLGGTTLALVIISFILGITLRSARFGVISLVPNLVPAIMGFGVWAMFVGSIGMSLSVVTGMTLGIVVDDTVHFLSKYLRARREHGSSPEDAIRYAFRTVGQAMLVTTVILVIGFCVLSFSAFRLNNWMAQLTAIVIALALVTDFILLPTLLVKFDKDAQRRNIEPKDNDDHETESVPA